MKSNKRLLNDRARLKKWRTENPGKDAEYGKRWRENNPDRARLLARERMRKYVEKKRLDPMWLLNRRVSARLSRSLKSKGGSKPRGWELLVGYTLRDLVSHLEALFVPGMSWANMGAWHIDHIRPISSFAFTSSDDESFRQCWALENLRPLWAVENLKKYNKMDIAA